MGKRIHYLANLAGVMSYDVRLEFTDRFNPSALSRNGLSFVSVQDEIHANSSFIKGEKLRGQYGRIPYGTPLYIWEVVEGEKSKILYIGQTLLLKLQKRFECHSAVMKLLADNVNNKNTKVFFRLCSRLDLMYKSGERMMLRAIEHFPLRQARMIVDNLEAYLIFRLKPKYNIIYKDREKKYTIPFRITETRNISIF